jgi:TetR/AcrR family transcriptional regulator, acrAB operon repressor
MKRTKEEADQTRQALLDAALVIFSRKGFSATRLEEIAEKAKVTRGAIYHHFNNKLDLYLNLMQEASQRGGAAIQRAIREGGTFIEVCTHILIYSLSLLEEDHQFREVMAMSLSTSEQMPELTAIAKMRAQQATALVEGIAAFMQQGMAQGLLRSDISPLTAARAFLAYQNGLISLWLANREAFSIKEAAPELALVLLDGLVKK